MNIIQQLDASIDQRLKRLDQALREEPNLMNSNDKDIRERLNTLEELKQQVKVKLIIKNLHNLHVFFSQQNHLNKRRVILDDIHQCMTQYMKLTTDVKTAVW